jgi:hypothetical protein
MCDFTNTMHERSFTHFENSIVSTKVGILKIHPRPCRRMGANSSLTRPKPSLRALTVSVIPVKCKSSLNLDRQSHSQVVMKQSLGAL